MTVALLHSEKDMLEVYDMKRRVPRKVNDKSLFAIGMNVRDGLFD